MSVVPSEAINLGGGGGGRLRFELWLAVKKDLIGNTRILLEIIMIASIY